MRCWFSNQKIIHKETCVYRINFKIRNPKYKQIIQQKLKLSENHPATYIRECLEIVLRLDEELTLISKLHTDSSIYMY